MACCIRLAYLACMGTRKNILLPLLAALLASAPAVAQSVLSTGQSFVEARLLPGAMRDGARMAGLELVMADGWKTYWRAPGEAGVPPRFDWEGSGNLARVEVLWPRPIVFESFGMRTIGYAGRVVLPLRLVPEDPAEPIEVSLGLELGVCKDICVLEETTLAARLAPDAQEGVVAVAAAEAAVPPAADAAGIGPVTCRITGAGEDRRFEAELHLPAPAEAPVVVLEGPEGAWFHGTSVEAQGAHLSVAAGLRPGQGGWIGREDIRITLLAGNMAADIRGCAAP